MQGGTFYTNCQVRGANILYRGYDKGNRIAFKDKYKPTLFVLNKDGQEFRTLDGRAVEPIQFDDIDEARSFCQEYAEVENYTIFGNQNYQYCYIGDKFPGTVDFNLNLVNIVSIDIETTSDNGFPNYENPIEQITAITMKSNGKFFIFGCGDYTKPEDRTDLFYFKCADEMEMITKFLHAWKQVDPDVVTGWNVNFFDVPYLVNRITYIMGEDAAKKLSPWGVIREKQTIVKHRQRTCYELLGISILDYIELYMKFAPQPNQESYKLDYICWVELGERKLSYEEYGDLQGLYAKNYQKFIEYNIRDVELVDKLEKKMKLIAMVVSIAFDAKVNFNDVFSQVRMWDAIIFNHLRQRKIVMPPKRDGTKNEQYAGAYVKEPVIGLHNWVVSFDLNSLYPHIIAQWNISPETLRPEMFRQTSIVDLLERKVDLSYLKDKEVSLAANGHHFDIRDQGMLPRILMGMYEERKAAKKMRLQKESELQMIEAEMKRRGIK